MLFGYATRSGKGILRPGSSVDIARVSRSAKKPQGGTGGFFRGKQKEDSIVRFSCRGEDIGRLPLDASRWLSVLLDAGAISVAGVCVDAPARLNVMDQCLLQVGVPAVGRGPEPLASPLSSAMPGPPTHPGDEKPAVHTLLLVLRT